MPARAFDSDLEIVRRYTDQPERLPRAVREAIETAWDGEPVQLYALADLDEGMRLVEQWVAMGPSRVTVATLPAAAREAGHAPALRTFERTHLREVVETPGLSCNRLSFLGAPDQPALAVVRYTQRQRKAMENLRCALQQALDGDTWLRTDPDAQYVESLVRPIRDAQALVADRDSAVLWRLIGYLRPYRARVCAGMAAATVLTLCGLLPPYLSGYLIDSVVEPAQSGALDAQRAAWLGWIAVSAMAAVYAIRQLANWIRLRLMTVLGEYVARDLRTELYEHIQDLSLSFFSRKKTGSLITRVSSDTDRLWEFLALGVVDVSLAAVTLVGLGVVLISLDVRLGLLMTLPVPLLCFTIARHSRRMQAIFLRAWRKWSNVTDVLSDTIPGIRVVKAFHQEDHEKHRFNLRNDDVTSEFEAVHDVWTRFWPGLMLGVHALIVGVWVLALPRLIGEPGTLPLSAGTFVSFLLYMTMFVHPIEVIGQMTRIMNRATSSAHRVFEVLDTQPEVVDCPQPVVLHPLLGHVRFRNVTFSYDGVRQVLKGVSFSVRAGEMIGLVGPSGGGKTTVINLLARFYDVSGGELTIDGVDVRELDAGSYRRQLGMVLQDPYLFHGTVVENIRYGSPDATLDQVVRAARAANAHDFICRLAHGYDTLVGERGQTLSGGERQRISIARAILHNPRILILDEATSSVDTETEYKIQEALDRLVEGRTVFAIAHRLSTLKRADRLLVIEGGRLAESGTHEELLRKPDGIYTRLHRMQTELREAV